MVSNTKPQEWFDWSGYTSSPTGSSSSDFVDAPLFAAALRISLVRRKVTVTYFSIQEAFAELSGSYSFSIGLGAGFAMLAEWGLSRVRGRREKPEPVKEGDEASSYLKEFWLQTEDPINVE